MVRNMLMLLVVVVAFLSSAELQAAEPENSGPTIIKFKMGKDTIDFTHRKHQKLANNQCWECHDKSNGKIINWGKAEAHKICIACHDLNQKGPVACKGCHKK